MENVYAARDWGFDSSRVDGDLKLNIEHLTMTTLGARSGIPASLSVAGALRRPSNGRLSSLSPVFIRNKLGQRERSAHIAWNSSNGASNLMLPNGRNLLCSQRHKTIVLRYRVEILEKCASTDRLIRGRILLTRAGSHPAPAESNGVDLPESRHAILHDFCMSIPYGAIIALVGVVGSFIGLGSRAGLNLAGLGLVALTSSAVSLAQWKRKSSSTIFTATNAIVRFVGTPTASP